MTLIEELEYAALCCQPGGERRALLERAIAAIKDMQKRLDRWEPKMSVTSVLSGQAQKLQP